VSAFRPRFPAAPRTGRATSPQRAVFVTTTYARRTVPCTQRGCFQVRTKIGPGVLSSTGGTSAHSGRTPVVPAAPRRIVFVPYRGSSYEREHEQSADPGARTARERLTPEAAALDDRGCGRNGSGASTPALRGLLAGRPLESRPPCASRRNSERLRYFGVAFFSCQSRLTRELRTDTSCWWSSYPMSPGISSE